MAIIALLLIISTFSIAQELKKTGLVKGKLINTATKTPFNDARVSIPDLNVFTNADGEGNFELSEVPFGNYKLVISGLGVKKDTLDVSVNADVVDIKDVSVTPNERDVAIDNGEIPTISVTDNNTSGSDASDGAISGGEELLIASRDPFVATTVYIFGGYFFKPRGQRNQNEAEINGITINNAQTGFLSWGQQLGNQTDVFRGRDVRYGLEASPYTFGGTTGSTYIAATAADFSHETRISYTETDHTYKHRIMFTTSTGLMKNGWAFTLSANKHWAKEGYVPGTYTDGYAYYAGASKKIGKGMFNLTTFGVPLKQARAAYATQESYDLAKDNYYNSDWGYQANANGQRSKRSSSIENVYQPTTIFNYEYKPSDKTRWNTALGYQFGKDRTSALDGYNASSPYRNYYRNMPSYYYTMVPPDSVLGNAVKQNIMANPELLQINWDRLYQVNLADKQTVYNVNGTPGNNVTGNQSLYVMGDKVHDLKKFTFNTNVEHALNEHTTLYGGVTFYSQKTEIYKQLTDLLGGDFFVNYNQFASLQYVGNPNYIQNNLNNPNAVIHTGDKYDYDYDIRVNTTKVWGQAQYNVDRFDLFAAVTVGDDAFNREGFMRNGLFPNNSYGKSTTYNFFDYAVKGGITYKIDRKNFLFVNAAYIVTPPTVDNTYISAATRDYTVANPTVQKTESIEGGYLMKSNKISARVVGYMTNVQDATEIKRFYDDDPAYMTFVNYAMQHENTKSIGTELMLNYRINRDISVTGVAAIGKAVYSNRPDINVYLDNDTLQHGTSSKAYIKNYYLAAGPQSAYTAAINYRPKNNWFASINFNYFDRNYVQINPNRRTQEAIGTLPVNSMQMQEILTQEKLPAAFTIDLHGGKSFQLSRMSDFVKKNTGTNTVLYINAGISNLLNNRDVIVRGSEQFRYDFTYKNPDKFANVYQYGYGINFYLNITLKF